MRAKSQGRLKVVIDMTFPKYFRFLERSRCTPQEKLQAVQMYSNNEGKMRQDLLKSVLSDKSNLLAQIDEKSVEESRHSFKK